MVVGLGMEVFPYSPNVLAEPEGSPRSRCSPGPSKPSSSSSEDVWEDVPM